MPAVQPIALKWSWQMTPLGVMAGALTPKGVGALVFAADPQAGLLDVQTRLERRFPAATWQESAAEFASVWRQVDALLASCCSGVNKNVCNKPGGNAGINAGINASNHFNTGSNKPALPALDAGGTDFQQRVWTAIAAIEDGHTASYGQLACGLGLPSGARAVAAACAANPLALLIPCHRVVAADGSLSGYRWGMERKRQLLQMESERRSGVTSSPNASLQT